MLNKLTDIAETLTQLGYEPHEDDGALIVNLNGFNAALTISNGQLTVTCQICKVIELNDFEDFAKAALLQNSIIQPFAFALLDGGDEGYFDDLAVLTNSVPLGNLSQDELASLILSLRRAILASKEFIRTAITNEASVCKC